jgi:hypothetical protein
MSKFSLSQQLEEVERELALRAKVYPRMVAKGQIRQSEADYHTQRMESVAETLRTLVQEGGLH